MDPLGMAFGWIGCKNYWDFEFSVSIIFGSMINSFTSYLYYNNIFLFGEHHTIEMVR